MAASIMQVASMVPASGSCLRGVVAFPQQQQQRVAARSVRGFRVRAESAAEAATGSVSINPSIKKEVDKVVDTIVVGELQKPLTAYCRSGTFPLCDGSHAKHNKATGDNVGPLLLKK